MLKNLLSLKSLAEKIMSTAWTWPEGGTALLFGSSPKGPRAGQESWGVFLCVHDTTKQDCQPYPEATYIKWRSSL